MLVRERYSTRNLGEITGYAVALLPHGTTGEASVWFGGGKLARDLSLPQLQVRWLDDGATGTTPGAERVTGSARRPGSSTGGRSRDADLTELERRRLWPRPAGCAGPPNRSGPPAIRMPGGPARRRRPRRPARCSTPQAHWSRESAAAHCAKLATLRPSCPGPAPPNRAHDGPQSNDPPRGWRPAQRPDRQASRDPPAARAVVRRDGALRDGGAPARDARTGRAGAGGQVWFVRLRRGDGAHLKLLDLLTEIPHLWATRRRVLDVDASGLGRPCAEHLAQQLRDAINPPGRHPTQAQVATSPRATRELRDPPSGEFRDRRQVSATGTHDFRQFDGQSGFVGDHTPPHGRVRSGSQGGVDALQPVVAGRRPLRASHRAVRRPARPRRRLGWRSPT